MGFCSMCGDKFRGHLDSHFCSDKRIREERHKETIALLRQIAENTRPKSKWWQR